MQPSQTPKEAKVLKENRKRISEDLNIFFSKIIYNAYETKNSLFSSNALGLAFVQISQQ